MYSISMSVIPWRLLCLLPAKDKTHTLARDETQCMTNATGQPCPANLSWKSPFRARATLQCFPGTSGENPPAQAGALNAARLCNPTLFHQNFLQRLNTTNSKEYKVQMAKSHLPRSLNVAVRNRLRWASEGRWGSTSHKCNIHHETSTP